MNIFNADKIMKRIDEMLENAKCGKPVETAFDETKMSAIETKFAHYLAMTGTSKARLADEKEHINELVSDISHQTKTPIANILLYSQLLEEAELSAENKLCVKSLMEQAEKLNFMIASLVKASRLETGIISLTPTLQCIQPMLEGVVKQADAAALRKNIVLTTEKTEICAVFDYKWTAEAIYNIVDNAIKYTPNGGSVYISVIAYQLFCKVDITDSGMGISEDETAKIFSRFYRSTEVSNIEGVGIGLYLAREIVGGQGGYIKVKSEIGKGSTFSVLLPM